MKSIIICALFGLLSLSANAENELSIYKDKSGQIRLKNINNANAEKYEQYKQQVREQKLKLSKKPDAKIGMTTNQVLNNTNWGTPIRIRTTTNAKGISEQWVYDDYQYLYFDNDKLTTIQQ